MTRSALFTLLALIAAPIGLRGQEAVEPRFTFDFEAAGDALSGDDRRFIETTASEVGELMRSLFPEFALP